MEVLKVYFEMRTLNKAVTSNAVVEGSTLEKAFLNLNSLLRKKTAVKNFLNLYYTVTYKDTNGRWTQKPKETIRGVSREELEKRAAAKKTAEKKTVSGNMYLKDGKMRSLSMTPARYKKYAALLTGAITRDESNIVKSILSRKTMTPGQLECMEDIYAKVNRRRPVNP